MIEAKVRETRGAEAVCSSEQRLCRASAVGEGEETLVGLRLILLILDEERARLLLVVVANTRGQKFH